jgi:serine/threonine protein kinase
MSEETQQLGRYELLRRIAVGGMGEIYLARAGGAGGFEKTLIIKKILPHLASDPQFVDKFLDEGRIIVNLSHGNIVPVFDMDEEDGEYYIAMEYVPGRDVRAVMKKLDEVDETLPADLACFVIAEVCEGLAYAHRQTDSDGHPLNIVHRDVSPSNVLLSTEGEVKLIDFGIARAAGRRSETVSGRVQGKVCYMSPEQATGEDVDARSDIFSAGTVLYEMMTGVRPFQGDTDLESLDLVRQCDYPPPSELADEVPTELDTVIERSMARHPDDRYDTADQMQADLVQILYGGGEAVTSRELAGFLSNLFPDGIERQEFKDELSGETGAARSSEAGSDGIDLDDALNQQLQQQRGRDGSAPDPKGRTATLETPSHPERVGTGAETEQGGPDNSADDEQSESNPERHAAAGGALDKSSTSRSDDSGSWWGGQVANVVILLVVVGSLGAVATYLRAPAPASLTLNSEPSGARVIIDGAEMAGVRTPGKVDVSPGRHTVAFRLDGYQSHVYSVDVVEGASKTLSPSLEAKESVSEAADDTAAGDATTLRANRRDVGHDASGAAPKQVRIDNDAGEGVVWRDGRRIGAVPSTVTLEAGERVGLEVRRNGCEPARRQISYETSPTSLQLRPKCSRSNANPDRTDQGEARAEAVSLRIESTPEGARVRIDGRTVGTTPYERTVKSDQPLTVELTKSGYQKLERQLTPSSVDGRWRAELQPVEQGCLNFFAVRPQYNELAIDGEWLEGRHQKLKDYTLPAGQHTIRVRNRAAGRDETFKFAIDPGRECTSLTVWDPDEGG